jgi:ABC-type transport system involved in cytochrome c biogenesis permease component
MAVLVLAVAVVCTPLLALFLDAPLFDYPLELVLVIVLGALGIAVVGSVFAATLLKVRSRDVLLPVILYPLLVPLFVAGTKTTAALVAVHANRALLDSVPRNLRRGLFGTVLVGLRVPRDRVIPT